MTAPPKLNITHLTALLLAVSSGSALADSQLSSWHTEDAGKYARLWPTLAHEIAEKTATDGSVTSITTWDYDDYDDVTVGEQDTPVYAGVQGIYYDTDYIYIESTGLPTNTMGPWYLDIYDTSVDLEDSEQFPAFPENAAIKYQFPRNTDYDENYTSPNIGTNTGVCGLSVNGVPLYNSTDTFSYSNSDGLNGGPVSTIQGSGDGVWNNDASYSEGTTLDSGNSHQAMTSYHYHASPAALRHTLEDSVDYYPTIIYSGLDALTESTEMTNPYVENFNGTHSPIIGWLNDGIPLYGPYGYSDPTDASSDARRMITGYQHRDGTNGSTDLAITGRITLPQWSVDQDSSITNNSLTATSYGPDVSDDFPIGSYLEDNAYKGDLSGPNLYEGVSIDGAYVEGTHYDLNAYNVRYCVTPEFPNGTWAYFTAIAPDGKSVFPYNLANSYFGDSSLASSITAVPDTATAYFEGAALTEASTTSISHAETSDEVTIVWDGLEGGVYRIDTSLDLSTWDETGEDFVADDRVITALDDKTETEMFYRLSTLGISTYENVDGDTVTYVDPNAIAVTYGFTFSGGLDLNRSTVTEVTVAGVTGTIISYSTSDSITTVEISFNSANAAFVSGNTYTAEISASGQRPPNAVETFTSTNFYTAP